MAFEDIRWKEHINRVENKAIRMLGFLKRIFENRDPSL